MGVGEGEEGLADRVGGGGAVGAGAAAEPGEEAVDEDGVEEGDHRPHERLRAPAHRGSAGGLGFRRAAAGSGRDGDGGESAV